MFAASNILIVVSCRYRIPLIPALAAIAGGAIVWLIDHIREKQWRALMPSAAVLIVAAIITRLWQHAPSHNFSEEWSMTAASLQALGRTAEAQEAVDRALAADSQSPLALLQSGQLRLQAQDFPGAEKAFANAVRISPNYHRARLDLGIAYKRRNDLEGALRELVKIQPDNYRAWLSLARLEGAARDPKAGVEMASKAVEIDGSQSEAWMLLTMLALDAGDAPTADRALTQAERLMGADNPAAGFAHALLDRLHGEPEKADARLKDLLRRYPGFQQAAQLLLANASDLGRREEAESFLRSLPR
jgi:tetratricopeptide (TPR) repeat protein